MTDPTDVFRLTTAAVGPIVDCEPEPAAETPCAEWNYAQLLGHLVDGDRLFLGVLSGQSGQPAGPPRVPEPDRPPPTPQDYRIGSARLADALADAAAQAGTYDLPVGRLRGRQVVLLRSVEHLLHGWDLARAAGAPAATLEPIAEALAEPARRLLASVGDQTLAERRPFAPPVEVGEDASTLSRFVAGFGRDPGWMPDPLLGYERIKEQFAGCEDVEQPDGTRRGFGADGLRISGLLFATPHRDRLMVKLPEDEVTDLLDAGLGLPLAKPGQRPMREWALVPFDGAAGRRADRAYAFVSGRG